LAIELQKLGNQRGKREIKFEKFVGEGEGEDPWVAQSGRVASDAERKRKNGERRACCRWNSKFSPQYAEL
jgi:hypothetical protein